MCGRVAGYAVSCEAHWDGMLLRAEEVLNMLHKQYYTLPGGHDIVARQPTSHTDSATHSAVDPMRTTDASEAENHVVNGLYNTTQMQLGRTKHGQPCEYQHFMVNCAVLYWRDA